MLLRLVPHLMKFISGCVVQLVARLVVERDHLLLRIVVLVDLFYGSGIYPIPDCLAHTIESTINNI